jgi:hypothetical protein
MLASSPRGLVVFVFLAIGAFYIQRTLWRKNRRSGGKRFGFFPTYTSAGNAFQQLQMLAEPQTEHVIQEKAIDQAEEDDDGEPEDEVNLMQQLRQIRNGDRSSQLVVSRVTIRDRGPSAWPQVSKDGRIGAKLSRLDMIR